MEPCRLSAVEAIKAIKDRRMSVFEWVKSCVSRIDAVEKTLHAWVCFNPGQILEKSRKIDNKINNNNDVGILCGAPIGVKDIIDTKDMPTCMGSPIWENFTPGHNARILDRLIWNGGVVAGKTVTSEFGVHYPGPTVNPHNFNHTPGTSSSGSAVAVAAFMVPMALGTQTLGSLIRPASYNGIYAMKPTFGLIPRVGILKTTDSLDQVGFFCRTIEDITLFFKVVAHIGPNYPYTLKMSRLEDKKKPYKIALVKMPEYVQSKDYVEDAVSKFAESVNEISEVIVEEVKFSSYFNDAWNIHKVIYEKCLSYYFKNEMANHLDKISTMMKDMISRGQKISQAEYKKNLKKQIELSLKIESFFNDYDFILTQSATGEAPEGLRAVNDKDSTLIWTMSGVSVLNIPLFIGPNGLPFGAQLIAKRYDDISLIEFAKYLKEKQLLPDAPNPIISY